MSDVAFRNAPPIFGLSCLRWPKSWHTYKLSILPERLTVLTDLVVIGVKVLVCGESNTTMLIYLMGIFRRRSLQVHVQSEIHCERFGDKENAIGNQISTCISTFLPITYVQLYLVYLDTDTEVEKATSR